MVSVTGPKVGRGAALVELLLPDYRRRHVFAAKLRLVIFVSFWAIYLYFLKDVIGQTIEVGGAVFGAFLLTGFAYANVMKERWLLPSFGLELISDLISITAVIYLTGGPHSPFYTIYVLYAFIVGVLYNFYLAVVVATVSAAFYGAFLLLCQHGIIPPLILDYGDNMPIPAYTPYANFLFTVIFLVGIVYTVKVASYFSQHREHQLERRNRQLVALNHMSRTVRSVSSLDELIDELLSGVIDGVGFETAVLITFDWKSEIARTYAPKRRLRSAEVDEVLGGAIGGREFCLAGFDTPVMQEIKKHRIIFRRDISELAVGLGGFVTEEQCRKVQELLGVKRVVIMPVVADDALLGVLIGFSREGFVEDGAVQTLDAFANQSALSLEAAELIDKLKRVNERLEEANRVKSEFLATMSHELRTPLTAIIGFSELLKEGVMGEPSEEQEEGLGEVLVNAADLLDMINSLLDLTKIESGKMRLNVNEFNVLEMVRRVAATVTPLVGRKNQCFELDLPDSPVSVKGDERKVQQSLLNLVANANKFTPDGGRIDIAVEMFSSPADIRKSAKWAASASVFAEEFSDGAVAISVCDDGIGIREDHLDSVFDMFHQVDGSATRNFGGTGLGLALTRQFIEMHGGRVWAESEFGKGACFRMLVPFEVDFFEE
jgi:signal transduction histidine kinase